MLRSFSSGMSGLRSHQTMLDVTGNNIANVNTSGFKSSTTRFQDTLSQITQGAGAPQAVLGGTNPAQIGLGVQVAGIGLNMTQGAAQVTGRVTDVMIAGEGFFVVNKGGQDYFTRAGSFDFDAQGRLVTPDGSLVQGWPAADGQVNRGGQLGPVQLPQNLVAPAQETTAATLEGNLPSNAEDGTQVLRDVQVYDGLGEASTLTLTFTHNGGQWSVSAPGGGTQGLAFTDGRLTGGQTYTAGGVTFDLAGVTGYADLSNLTVGQVDGRAAGTLQSYSMSPNGTLVGTFSNGGQQVLGQIALASFANPAGLEKVGDSLYAVTANSGAAEVGEAGAGGMGSLSGGALEMSNVDLSQEFTNLIIAQRGFQANSRVITTSDELLGELVNLKR